MDQAPTDTFENLSTRIADLCEDIHGTESRLLDLIRRRDVPAAVFLALQHYPFDCHTQADGSVSFKGRVPAEVGALLLQSLDQAMERLDHDAGPGDEGDEMQCQDDSAESSSSGCRGASDASATDHTTDRPTLVARRADALALLAEGFLALEPGGDDSLSRTGRDRATWHASAESSDTDG